MVRSTRHHDFDHYLKSPSYLRTESALRTLRTLYIDIEGIEPRSKRAMGEGDKLKFQTALLRHLEEHSRRAFRTPLAVEIGLETTDRNPPHTHTIVKNLLDLLARPVRGLPTRRRALVYNDDAQISVLSVTCRHGGSAPRIHAKLRPLRDLLLPMEMASEAGNLHEDGSWWDKVHQLDVARERLFEIRADEAWWRGNIGNEKYEDLERFALQSLQEPFLGRGGLMVPDIARMYNLCGRGLELDDVHEAYDASLLRIRLSEVPQIDGQSTTWKNEICTKLQDFSQRWGHIINPLRVPIALEVVIKPPPPSRQRNVHDLDNFLRTYLLPRVLDVLKPPSDIAFALGRDTEKMPPLSTRIGVSRYEAWRLPPAQEGAHGFVSVAIVTDLSGNGSVLRRIERAIDRWADSLD